jgi:capsule polysaccharide export protein KpsE/RkpR
MLNYVVTEDRGSRAIVVQFDLMQAVNAPATAWRSFASEIEAELVEVNAQLASSRSPAEQDELRAYAACIEQIARSVQTKLDEIERTRS